MSFYVPAWCNTLVGGRVDGGVGGVVKTSWNIQTGFI